MGLSSTGFGAEPAKEGSRNAAMRYWHAFDAYGKPELDLADYLDPLKLKPLDEPARKLLEDKKVALQYLRRGAAMPYCDWGLHLEDGPALLLPHLQKTRDLAKLGCLNMRRNFEESKPSEAVADLLAVLTLARHLGSDQTMIAMLVQFVVEANAHQTAAPYLTRLDERALHDLSGRLTRLPPASTLRNSIVLENEAMLGWLIQRIGEKLPPEQVEKIMGGEGSYTKLFNELGAEGAIKQLQNLQKDYEELAKALALPRAQQDANVEAARKKMEANPFGKLLVPAVNKVRTAEDKANVRRALFASAIELAAGGVEAAKRIKDPAGDGPFEIQKLERGYELRSKFLDNEKPVTLRVGTAGK
jgi:hypothetical protein